jgi:hypothetical protein
LQADRTDVLIAAMAACASPETIERARRELLDRGPWAEPRDRIDKIKDWFDRHVKSDPGARLSSTIRSFSADVHRRRRSGPERTVTVMSLAHQFANQ